MHDANFGCSFGSPVHFIGPHILIDLLLFNLNTPTINGFQECASSAKQLFLLILIFLPLYELFSGFYICCHVELSFHCELYMLFTLRPQKLNWRSLFINAVCQ